MLSSKNQVCNSQSPIQMIKPNQALQTQLQKLTKDEQQSYQSNQDHNENIQGQQQTSSRKDQNIIIYFLNVILSFCISFQNIILVFTQDDLSKAYMSIAVTMSTIFICLLSTYYLCKDKWKIINLYILLDNIFLTQVASSFGFVGFLLVIYGGYWHQVITMMAFPLEIIFFVGNFRIMMLHVKWSKWRIILYKLVLLADSAVFFQIGAYYMSSNFQYTKGDNPILDGKVKDFVLLYIFGLFALFVELYSKMCDIDQTSQLRFDYQFKEMEQEKRLEQIRKSVLGANDQLQQIRESYISKLKKQSFIEVQAVQALNL